MTYRIRLINPDIAAELNQLVTKFDDDLLALLEKARQIEQPDDVQQLTLGIGEVLATLGACILFPIYRKHPHLTPPQLVDTIENEKYPPPES